jgi:pimeloyl-ACP methyl ester carboxylesterase
MSSARHPIRLASRRHGTGPAVVLLHGLNFSGRMWDGLVPQLVRAGFQAITVDVRGHGASPSVDAEVSLDDLTADVAALVATERLERSHLVGFSMGGMIAMRLALETRLASLTLISTSAEADPRQPEYEEMAEALRELELNAELADAFLAMVASPAFVAAHPEVKARYREIICSNDRTGIYRASIAVIRRPTVLERLAAVKAPSLVLCGEDDAATPPSCSRALHSAIAGSRLVCVPGAAHLVNEEQPEIMARALLTHLEERRC